MNVLPDMFLTQMTSEFGLISNFMLFYLFIIIIIIIIYLFIYFSHLSFPGIRNRVRMNMNETTMKSNLLL